MDLVLAKKDLELARNDPTLVRKHLGLERLRAPTVWVATRMVRWGSMESGKVFRVRGVHLEHRLTS